MCGGELRQACDWLTRDTATRPCTPNLHTKRTPKSTGPANNFVDASQRLDISSSLFNPDHDVHIAQGMPLCFFFIQVSSN